MHYLQPHKDPISKKPGCGRRVVVTTTFRWLDQAQGVPVVTRMVPTSPPGPSVPVVPIQCEKIKEWTRKTTGVRGLNTVSKLRLQSSLLCSQKIVVNPFVQGDPYESRTEISFKIPFYICN